MKTFTLNALRIIWSIIQFIFVVIGTIGAFLAVLMTLLCFLGLLLNAVISGWDKAFDLTLMPLFISIGTVFCFVILRAIGNLGKNN